MKNILFSVMILAMIMSLIGVVQPVQSQSDGNEITRDMLFVPGQVVVGFEESVQEKAVSAEASALAGEVQAAVVKVYGSMALLQFEADADVEALSLELGDRVNVKYAEPNYLFWLPEPPEVEEVPQQEYIVRTVRTGEGEEDVEEKLVPIKVLQQMTRRTGGKIQTVYPNDPYLWQNNGWVDVNASIVFPNKTPSRVVCVIDTGVDNTHPDLSGRIIMGRDFVNDDANPMDDHGHGTHVAGIIAAKQNNKQGMAGVSTGKVVAVKALSAMGFGTNLDIASSIYYCANRSDVGIINLSLGGPFSWAVYDAVSYSAITRGKLIVASAGNSNTSSTTYSYPAALSTSFPNRVLAVGASGSISGGYINNSCRASYSNFGSWVDIIAPGTEILSTLPWKKPFLYQGSLYRDGYAYLSGTSMAAPFVAAVAARSWGLYPSYNNVQVSQHIKSWGNSVNTECWPAANSNTRRVNVAASMHRGAAIAIAFDANTYLPLHNATITAHQGGATRGSVRILPSVFNYSDGTRTMFYADIDLINLPASTSYMDYELRVNRSGFTTSPQAAFINNMHPTGRFIVYPGSWVYAGEAFIPPRTTNFTGIRHSWSLAFSDLSVYLPNLPKPVNDGQPARFIVGFWGYDYGYYGGDSTGSLYTFPYARHMATGYGSSFGYDSIVIRSKPGSPARPYYTGDYVFAVYNPSVTQNTSFFMWKDGVIKQRVNMNCSVASTWWRPMTLTQRNGVAHYQVDNYCGGAWVVPYSLSDER
jgi:subtilisin family serine protease